MGRFGQIWAVEGALGSFGGFDFDPVRGRLLVVGCGVGGVEKKVARGGLGRGFL